MKSKFICLALCALIIGTTGCGRVEMKRQQAYEAGMNQASSQIQRNETETLNVDEANTSLGLSVAKKKEEGKQAHEAALSESEYSMAESVEYEIDTLNNRVHRHGVTCSLRGDTTGRATIEAWTGTLEEAVAKGYTKCPECILKIGM